MSLYLFYIFIYIAVEFKVKLVLNFIYFVMCGVVWSFEFHSKRLFASESPFGGKVDSGIS